MTEQSSPLAATARRSPALKGHARMPGDLSISLRALILGGLASGETRIRGLPDDDNLARTADAMSALGARIDARDGETIVRGVGNGCLLEPVDQLDFGDAGAGSRLVMGLAGVYDMRTAFRGGPTLTGRPVGRVLDPLRLMCVQVKATHGDRLPLVLRGPKTAAPISFRVPMGSAHVKSAVLLAGLNAPGVTTVTEPVTTRDHTEKMLRAFGARLEMETDVTGAKVTRIEGQTRLAGQSVTIPGDPSWAALAVVAALIVPGSDVMIQDVSVNPTRTGLLETLREMGGSIDVLHRRANCGEDVADLRVRSSGLRGVAVPAARWASMVDEHAPLAVAAAFAEGETLIQGTGALDTRHMDRLQAIADGLKANAVDCDLRGDRLAVRGVPGGRGLGGGTVADRNRTGLSFLVMGLASENAVAIGDVRPMGAAFARFVEIMRGLGAGIA